MEIFTKNHVMDSSNTEQSVCEECNQYFSGWDSKCRSCGKKYSICVATGTVILDQGFYTCKSCKHKALETEITSWIACPLCHASL